MHFVPTCATSGVHLLVIKCLHLFHISGPLDASSWNVVFVVTLTDYAVFTNMRVLHPLTKRFTQTWVFLHTYISYVFYTNISRGCLHVRKCNCASFLRTPARFRSVTVQKASSGVWDLAYDNAWWANYGYETVPRNAKAFSWDSAFQQHVTVADIDTKATRVFLYFEIGEKYFSWASHS